MRRKGVFIITNTVTGKVYVGSSNTNLDQRLYDYWEKLLLGTHHNAELQADFNYYGRSNFNKRIIASNCRSEYEVRQIRENEIYLNRFNTYNHDVPVTYNGGNPNAHYGASNGKRNTIIPDLIGIIDKENLSSNSRDYLIHQVLSGSINSEDELIKRIRKYKKFSNRNVNKFAALYCNFSEYTSWHIDFDKIVFERKISFLSSEKEQKTISIYSIEEVVTSEINRILNSKPIASLNLTVKELGEFFCKVLNFNSYELIDKNHLKFDSLYYLNLGSAFLEKLYKSLNSRMSYLETENELKRIINLIFFKKPLEEVIFEYCEYKNIKHWDLISKDTVLIYLQNNSISFKKVNEIIKEIRKDYRKLNEKSGTITNALYGFIRFTNTPSKNKRDSVDSLLKILITSDIPLSKKRDIKERIKLGKIYTKSNLDKEIGKFGSEKRHTNRRLINREGIPENDIYNEKNKKSLNEKRRIKKYNEIKQLINYVDKFKSSISKDLREELINDIKSEKITNKTQITKRVMKNSARNNTNENFYSLENRDKKNIVDFGKRNEERKKQEQERQKQEQERLESNMKMNENLIKYVYKFKSTTSEHLRNELIKDIHDGKITTKSQIARRAMKGKK